jgi:kynurenine aminotransferase
LVRISTLAEMFDNGWSEPGDCAGTFLAPSPTGWLIGPPELTSATLAASTRIIFCTNSPLQEAVAVGLELAPKHHFFEDQRRAYTERRDLLTSYFDKLGLGYTMPEGSYFVLVDVSQLKVPEDYPFPDVVLGRGKDFKWVSKRPR